MLPNMAATSGKSSENHNNNVSIMKTKAFFNAFVLLLSLASFCSCIGGYTTCGGEYTPEVFYMSNQSGHAISIVHRPSCTDLPDSLVLPDGNEYIYRKGTNKKDAKIFFWPLTLEGASRIIYYDGRYALNFDEVPVERRFYYEQHYEYQSVGSGIFVFTPEDFDYAVEHGRDLGER